MKMKNLAGAFLALAAMFGFATVRAADIYDVHACDRYGKSIDPSNLPFYTPDESMGSGVTAYFKVRFLPRQERGQFSTNLWQFVYTGLSSQSVQQPKIGIFVSGVQTEATYVGMPDTPEVAGTLPTGEAYYYSDLIFAYTTKPGDFALPVVLAAKGADGRPTPASDVSTKISEYFLVNQGQNGWKLQFPMYDGSVVPSATWSIAAGVPNLSRLGLDPSLSKAGYCVKTVDFASAWEKPGVAWRVVHQGSTKTEKYEPQLEAKPAAALAEVLYVWSDDESSVVVDGREVTSEAEWQSLKDKLSLKEPVWMKRNVYLPETGKTKTRRVAMVKIDGGATTGDLTLRGVAQNTSTKLYLSAYDHFNVSDATSDDIVDYVTVPVACSEPLPPSVTVTTSTADAVAGYNYGHYAARLTVSLPSPEYAASVPAFTVRVETVFNSVVGVVKTNLMDKAADGSYLWGEYVRFSEDLQDVGKNLPSAKSLPTVTLGGGVESASIYVFCLRADKWTQNENLLEFEPHSDDAPADIRTWTPGGFNVTAQVPEITEPAEGAKLEGSVYQYDDYPLTIKVEGSYADGLSSTGYTVRVRYGNGEFEQLPGTYFPNGEGNVLTKTGTTSERPVLNFPESGENQTADIEVIAPASGRKSSEPDTVYRRIVADVKKQKTIGVEVTLPRKTEAIDTIEEGKQVAFKVHLSDAYPGASAVYAYIQVTNEYVWAGQFDFKAVPPFIVGCTNKAGKTFGLEIPRGTTESVAKQNTVTLLDGYDDLDGGLTLDFNVLLSTEDEWSKAQLKPIKGYSMDGSEYSLTLMVTNVMPSVKSVKLDGTAVKTDPANPTRVAASDTRWQKFEVALEEPSDYDVKNDEPSLYGDGDNPGLRLKWEAYLDGELQANETLADFHSKTVAFSNLFETVGSWEIRIWAKDKDMADFTDDDEPTYVFPLEVVDSPTIIVNGGEERRVNETDARATVEVELSLWPKEVTGTLVVDLSKEVGRVGTKGDWGELELETNRVEFTKSNWNRKQSIRVIRMDGTDLTGLYGWDVQGKASAVVSASGAESEAPNLPCVAGRVYIDNEAPNGNDESRSFSPDANTNVWEVAGGAATTHPLKFFVRTDVERDFTATATNDDWKVSEGVWTNGIKVTIMGGGGESYDTDGFVKGVKYFSDAGSGTFVPNFGSSQGDQEVTIMIDDKDGGHLSRTWKFTVTPSKYLTTVATGPSGGTSSSALSQKYSGATGLGEGHVFALNKTFTKANDFRLHWNCSKDAKASLYAWGYKVGAVDDGTLDTHDQPLDRTGAAAAGVAPETYYHYGDPELDSFLYCWIQTVTDEKGAETSSYLGAIAPERVAKAGASMAEVTLPDMNKDAKDNVYPETVVEAIFSREWLAADNMGDINWDGIPDLYVNQYKFDVIDETTGAIAEGGKDLKSLRDFNADLDKDGAASPDYLPTGSEAVFGTSIPGLPETWKDVGKEFTAILEIRGYGNGLNDAPVLAGITGAKPDRIYEDPDLSPTSTLSKVEFLAWSEYAAANGLGLADTNDWTKWSPERPTSPILDDTDGDGFTDGYEYYFWYKAHVGYMEDGVHRYLTGRAYDPKNPGEGKFIPSVVIARLMDPRSDLTPVDVPASEREILWLQSLLAEDKDTRDTDNDGLPDLLEFEIGTNPFDFDTDGDGLPDGFELMLGGTDPLLSETTPGVSDAMRNYDGDAMAFTTPKFEKDLVQPTPKVIDDLFTFALVDPQGDTDGIQWYVGKAAPTNIVPLAACVTGTYFRVDNRTYVSSAKVPVVDGRLATDLPKETTWEVAKLESLTNALPSLADIAGTTAYVALMPTRVPAGSEVGGVDEEATYATLAFGEKVGGVNAAWVYGRSVSRVTKGDSLANIGGFGMLAIGRYQDAAAKRQIAALPAKDDGVAYLHHFVYQEFGFDPRTAWNANTPLAPRWGKTVGEGAATEVVANNFAANYSYAGIATRTREYTLYDEFLVLSFFLNNGKLDLADVTATKARPWEKIWSLYTTNGQGPNEPNWEPDNEDYKGRTAETNSGENGCDTDQDGVPDGWELYVMAGPKQGGKYNLVAPYDDGYYSSFGPFVADAAKASVTDNEAKGDYGYMAGDGDGLTELQEFAGTDSCGYYNGYDGAEGFTVYSVGDKAIRRPEEHKQWLNKFFPTDPWNEDTDNDSLKDNEFKNQNGFKCGNFLYGTPVDDGKSCCIPGGGLNPCTVDTDMDGLPDPWEAQFAGEKIYTGDDAEIMTGRDGTKGNPKQGLCDGMDGTVFDAFNTPHKNYSTGGETETEVVILNGTAQVVDRDYDKDGLENWQEYLTGAMRCWRYDDPLTRWDAIPDGAYYDEFGQFDISRAILWAKEAAPKEEINDANAFWYATLLNPKSAIYNPHLLTGMTPCAQYFTRIENGWDPVYGNGETYYLFHDRFDWGYMAKPRKYACCSPLKADTDQDGMDDYWELFHGLNPLLGESGVLEDSDGPCDIVFDAWYDGASAPVSALHNSWLKSVPGNGDYDFTVHPWLNGLAAADPDGDDIRNQDEAIMPLVAPSATWYHTDPTPLWMTDSSYSNSLVRLFFRMPVRFNAIPGVPESVTDPKGREIPLVEFQGYSKGKILAFAPDYWDVSLPGYDNWAYSFEENEGYDTDHDSTSDFEELQGKVRSKTDPQDADSPRRRQAMHFGGPANPSALQSMPFVEEAYPRATLGYPDDMSFLQYTVECWVKPESTADATVIERTSFVDPSHCADERYVRRNFRLAIRDGKWHASFDANGTLDGSTVEVLGKTDAAANAWTYVAATYDANRLTLYVNGKEDNYVMSSLKPEYGSSAVVVYPGDGTTMSTNGVMTGDIEASKGEPRTYWFDREYSLHAFLIGASFSDSTGDRYSLNVMNGRGWRGYHDFFTGCIDEVRVWDGAQPADVIESNFSSRKRYTREDAIANRNAFYDQWATGRVRYNKDGNGKDLDVIPELRFHWAFDSIPGAENAAAVAQAPHGFLNVLKPVWSAPEGYAIPWWSTVVAGYGSVYAGNLNWVPWIPNTVTHLPRFDGTTLDSAYWSEDYAGDAFGSYRFARTAEPVSKWTQMIRNATAKVTEFRSTSRRFWLSYNTGTNGTSMLSRFFEFTGRHLNQTGDDLLPLGGAFVKYVDEMWDDQGASTPWEQTGADADNDGLPDWWQEYAEQNYRRDVPPGEDITWNTLIWYGVGGAQMRITAGEAYLRDLAKGAYVDANGEVQVGPTVFAQIADEDADGVPDWWSDLYGIRGESGLADHDNDGLPNYVEYLLSEVFDFKIAFNPVVPDSVQKGVSDYFYKIGELYAGEIFTDHDLVDDLWEDIYPETFASRRVYDAFRDADSDGWSLRSECRYSKAVMPIVADQVSHYSTADGLTADYPIPTVELTLHYKGAKSDAVEKAPIVVQMTTEKKLESDFEAVFKVAGTASETTGEGQSASTGQSSKNSGTDATTAYTRSLGKWSNRHALGTLTPGYINQNSVKLEFCYDPSSELYSWTVWPRTINAIDKRGTRAEFDADKRKYGDENIQLMSRDTDYRELINVHLRTDEGSKTAFWENVSNGERFGTLDLVSGAFDIDFGAFKGQSVVNGTNAADSASLEDQTYRIAYSVNPSVGLPRKLYLGEATTGHVREGRNTIIAFADLDGNGAYTAGEPYGCVTDVNVSWRGTAASIDLSENSAVCPRMNIADGTSDREFTWGTESGYWTNHVAGVLNGGTKTRVRIVRSLYKGMLSSETYDIMELQKAFDRTLTADQLNRVVLDKYMDLSVNPLITEADFFAAGELDIDWSTLTSDIPDNIMYRTSDGEFIKFCYRIVLGDGTISPTELNNLHNIFFGRVFDTANGRQSNPPVGIAPGPSAEGILTESSPTFRWELPGMNTASTVCSYPAFRIVVTEQANPGTVVYDSGIQRTPALKRENNKYVYEWKAPLFVGDRTLQNKVFENHRAYSWKVSMYNCKFKSDCFSAPGNFYVNVATNGYDRGNVDVDVRYFGPTSACLNKIVRVRAYTSPDFTGTPVAGASIDLGVAANRTSLTNCAVNCRIIGLPKGSYYLQAFIDSNANGVCDSWESMGYLCPRDGSTPDYLNPTAIAFDGRIGKGDTAVIYIEDSDSDGDGLPDAWEYAQYGSLAAKGAEQLSETAAGEFVINQGWAAAIKLQPGAKAPSAGLAGLIGSTLRNAGVLALSMGAPTAGYDSFAAAISGFVSPELVEDGVRITGLDMTDGMVSIKVEAETASAGAAWIEGRKTLEVMCQVKWKATLADSVWTNLGEPFLITVGAEASEIDISGLVPAGDSGFYSVDVYKK